MSTACLAGQRFSTWGALAERVALERHDGHLALLRFTGGWKASFGTPDLGVASTDHGHLLTARSARSAEEACRDLLLRERLLSPWDALQAEICGWIG